MGLHLNSDLDFALPVREDPTSLLARVVLDLHRKVDAMSKKVFAVTSAFIEMPPDGIPFNELGWQALPAEGMFVTVIQFQVPTGNNGVIKWLGNEYLGSEFIEGTGDVIWQIWADGEPITNFEKILGSLGSPSSPSETAPIRIYESQSIALVLKNVSVPMSGQNLGGRLSGWYYPTSYDDLIAAVEEEADE